MDKVTNFWICNCEYGHHNCNCDGKTGAKKLKCIGKDCDEYIYSKDFGTYRCDECYRIWIEWKEREVINESTANRDM